MKDLLMRWWANKELSPVSIRHPYRLYHLAGAGTLVNLAQQQEQLERQERLEEERRQAAAEETARNSAERKRLVVRVKPPQVQLPMCDLYEAEALINRLVQRSPVLVNGYQGTGKSTLLSRMVASRRSDVDITFNQPAYRLSLRKCLRDRCNEPGVLFRLIAEEIGLGKAVQEGFVHDNFDNAHQYFVGALEDLRRDGYEPCLFVLRQQAGGWFEWLLELHEAGLLRLVLVTSAGGVYLDLIKFSGFEARLERAHMPEVRQARLVDYLLNEFNPHSCDADTLAFDEESAPEFARIFTGFTDILFATSSPSFMTRIRHARNKIKKAIQRDSCYREIFASIPCELADFEERLPNKTLSELEKLLDYLVDRGMVAWTGSTIVWNRKIIREAYQRMKQDEDDALKNSGFSHQFSLGYGWFKRALGFNRNGNDSNQSNKIPLAAAAAAK
ncbi:hypothetical protein BDF22DRAFT_668622 [Syncephalis plumigaleata]|nr:hypothetical protein BDF22DRAFT_668622 [Syncephalis plumigaleata]